MGAISLQLALVSDTASRITLTITHCRHSPRSSIEKASGREGQLEGSFLLWQVYFSLQLRLTKMSLCVGVTYQEKADSSCFEQPPPLQGAAGVSLKVQPMGGDLGPVWPSPPWAALVEGFWTHLS